MIRKSAFSIIELAIVVLIIGILIVGVFEGQAIVIKARLNSAQSQTAQSPVNNIANLAVWYETTSEKSFNNVEASDGSQISKWYDLNSQGLKSLNALQSNSAAKPIYKGNVTNGLPMLRFNGSGSYLETAYYPDLNPGRITIFTVVQTVAVATDSAIVSSRNTSPNSGYSLYAIAAGSNPSYKFTTGDGNSSWMNSTAGNAVIGTAQIISATNNNTSSALYVNGTAIGTNTATMIGNTARNLRIGAGANESTTPLYYYNGYIGELIIFSRVLQSEERKSVEKYLSRKWGIAVN